MLFVGEAGGERKSESENKPKVFARPLQEFGEKIIKENKKGKENCSFSAL